MRERAYSLRFAGLDRAGERVAGGRLAVLVAAAEPPASLLRGAVRPLLRIDLTLGRLLDPVVADGGRRVEAVVDVGLRQLLEKARRDRVRGPDAGVAVGLELGADGRALGPGPAALGALERPEQVLDVMPVLVRDHVRLRERAPVRPEPCAQLLEEPQVDVDLPVGRTVERPDLRARVAAAGLRGVGEEDGLRRRVLPVAALERPCPAALDAVDDTDAPPVVALVGVLAALVHLVDL